MKKLFIITILFLFTVKAFATDARSLDSLKTLLQNTTNDTLKSGIYRQIAAEYLQYDTIKSEGMKRFYQNEALNYTMLALHNYSYYGDTLGVRTCFEYLAKVYLSQAKYSQAKWFLLQANKIYRDKNDVPGVITSLIKLSTVKMTNEEYDLAMKDLDEALLLATTNKMPQFSLPIYQNYAFLYNRMGDEERGDQASERVAKLSVQLKKDEAAMAILDKSGRRIKKPLKVVPAKTIKPKLIKDQPLLTEKI